MGFCTGCCNLNMPVLPLINKCEPSPNIRGDSSIISSMPGCGPNTLSKNLDIVSAVSSLYLNNLASWQKADHFCGGRDMSGTGWFASLSLAALLQDRPSEPASVRHNISKVGYIHLINRRSRPEQKKSDCREFLGLPPLNVRGGSFKKYISLKPHMKR